MARLLVCIAVYPGDSGLRYCLSATASYSRTESWPITWQEMIKRYNRSFTLDGSIPVLSMGFASWVKEKDSRLRLESTCI